MSVLEKLLQEIGRLTNFSPDQVNFVFCMLLCFPLGTVFRLVLHPSRVSAITRRAVGLVWGLAVTWFCFERQILILISFGALCYVLTWLLNPSVVHRYVLAVSMGFLSVAHLHRQITDYGGYTLDFTGPLMILVQRTSYVAFSVHDGLARDESKLTEEQRRERLKKVPSLLEYFSYLFHYSMILAGPVCTFREFNDFIDGSDIRPKDPGQKEPSPMSDVLRKIAASLVCVTVILLTGSNYPIARNGDPEFIRSHRFLWRVLYSWISILSVRMRYYFAFKLAEAVNNMCGLGFNGYDENGKAQWNRVTNVNILKLEFATNLKQVLDNWNICTVLWLRRIVYERVPHHRTLAVFVMSAFWHGFYPGYYMAFTTCGLMVEAARKVRRICRPYFQGSCVASRVYDVLTCAVTIFCLTFTTIPFVALELRIGLDYWRWLVDAFEKFDKNKDGSLGLKEVQRLVEALNVKMSPGQVKKKFKEVNTDGDAALDKAEFAAFFKTISTRKEIVNLLKQYSSNGAHMTVEDFQFFLVSDQEMHGVSKEYCLDMILSHEPTETGKKRHELGIDGLTSYLRSPEGDIFNPAHDQIYQDMSHPMTHYYIASSHNTYLLHDQLRGPSSVDAYINALKKGCRCVELDCWDGENGEPIVYHGHTLTSKIFFKDIIEAVKKHAFEVSEYPVILSLENHCSLPNQQKMAQLLEEILGDLLYKVPVDSEFTTFPSPEFFKNRILIKGKKLKPEQETEDDGEGYVTDEDEAADISHEAQAALDKTGEGAEGASASPPVKRKEKKPKKETIRRSFRAVGKVVRSAGKFKDETDEAKGAKKKEKQKLAKELSRCVNYVSSVGFKGFEHAKQNYKFHEMSSFVESKMTNLANSQGAEYVEYNKRQLSRIYPAGGRVDSSNYNPQQAWNAGCQIVALNYQTDSEPMHLNQGKFRTNGRAGYILKPKHLRDPSLKFNPHTKTEIPGVEKVSLSIKVISGQQLPKPTQSEKGEVIDPYVKVEFHGIPADTSSFKTKVVKDNGFNPVWDDEKFVKVLLMPELVMIRFAVFDEDVGIVDDFIGQFSLPYTSLRPGYRHIHLLSNKGEALGYASLFVHIEINSASKPPKDEQSSFEEAASPRISTSS